MSKPTLQAVFGKRPDNAIAYLQDKKVKPSFDYTEVQGRAHDHAFVVAHMTQVDLLEDVRRSLVEALETGQSFDEWKDTIEPTMRAKGWWGKRVIVDGQGQARQVQLGSPHRLRTIFNTNINTAYQKGREVAGDYDIWQYAMWSARNDSKTRPSHAANDGKVFRRDDPYYQAIKPRKAFNCRCDEILLTAAEVEREGYKPIEDLSEYVTTETVTVGGTYTPARSASVNIMRLPNQLPYQTDAGWVHAADAIPMQAMLDKAALVEPMLAAKTVSNLMVKETVKQRFNNDVKGWIEQVDTRKPKGEFRHVGALTATQVQIIASKKEPLESAIITVHDRLTLKHIDKERKHHDRAWMNNIALNLANGGVLYWDNIHNVPLLVFDLPDAAYKLVVQLKQKIKGRNAVDAKVSFDGNLVRTLVLETTANLNNGSNYERLE